MTRIINITLAVLSLAAAVKISVDFLQMLLFISRDFLNPDALIYLTMGRGMLNGLVPYRDLFESKPPGIFYLGAISAWFHSFTFLRVLEVCNLVFLPVVCSLFAWRFWRKAIIPAFLFGALLSLRAHENAGGLQSEIFGLIPAGLYIVSIVGFYDYRKKGWLLIRSLLFLAAISIREPYGIGMIAASLIVVRNWKDCRDLIVLPVLCAVPLLLILGGFSYITIYIPSMILRVQEGINSPSEDYPLFVRLLWINRFFSSLTIFSTMSIFGYAVSLMWVSCVAKGKLSFALLIVGLIFIHEYYVLSIVLFKTSQMGISVWQTLTDSSFIRITIEYVIGSALYVSFAIYCLWKGIGKRVFLALLCVVLLSLSISIGGYLWNYMLYAFPALLCVLFLFLKQKQYREIFVVLLCIATLQFTYDERNFYSQTPGLVSKAHTLSKDLDAIMDSCGFKTYAYTGFFPEFALSKYSPIGPMFIPYFHPYVGLEHELYAKTVENIRNAPLLIEPVKTPKGQIFSVTDAFQGLTPPCAEGKKTPEGYRALYQL